MSLTASSTDPLPSSSDLACPSTCIHLCSHAAVAQTLERPPRRGRAAFDIVNPPSPMPESHSCRQSEDDPVAYHVAMFPVPMRGPLFPGECLHLRVSVVSALHLFADVTSTGLRSDAHDPPHPGWPCLQTHLLRRTVAVAPSPTSPVGALATFRPTTLTSNPNAFHLHLIVLARYRLLAPPQLHRPYPCVLVSLLCDIPPPTFAPSHSCSTPMQTPATSRLRQRDRYLTPRSISNHRTLGTSPIQRTRPRTRSQTAATAAAAAALPPCIIPSDPPRDSFPSTSCFPRFVVRNLHASTLIARAHSAAIAAASHEPPALDPNLLLHPPPAHACPTQWSFWLCSALPSDTSSATLACLLSETSPLTRLARLVQILLLLTPSLPPKRSSSPSLRPPRKRRKVSVNDNALPVAVPTDNVLHSKATKRSVSQKRSKSDDACLTSLLEKYPWPSSAAQGFQRVNLRYPCIGYFSILRPSL